MPKKMTDAVIEQLKEHIDRWSPTDGPLSWEAICALVKLRFGCEYTRQGLHKIEGIRIAYTVRRDALKRLSTKTRMTSTELQRALERIARLEAERDRLRAENRALLEQFIVWTYNASTNGMSDEFLSRPLPPIDRDPTPMSGRNGGRPVTLQRRTA
jgi:hypothetical protein